MKILGWSLIFIWLFLSQETRIIKTKYSSKEAVIFSKNYIDIPVIEQEALRFTPDLNQILLVEKYLCDSVKDFKGYYRQYAGYLFNENDSIIVSNLLKSSVIKKHEEVWKTDFIFGLGSYYERNQKLLYYNLTAKKTINPK